MAEYLLNQALCVLWYLCKQWSKQITCSRASTALCSPYISSHLCSSCLTWMSFHPHRGYSIHKLTARTCFSNMRSSQHIWGLIAVHLSATASVKLTIVNAWEHSLCEQYMAGWVPWQCLRPKVSTSQLTAQAIPISVLEESAYCDCSLLSLSLWLFTACQFFCWHFFSSSQPLFSVGLLPWE